MFLANDMMKVRVVEVVVANDDGKGGDGGCEGGGSDELVMMVGWGDGVVGWPGPGDVMVANNDGGLG